MSKDVTRLFKQFEPEHYDLSLALDKTAMKFSGVVTIRGKKVGRPSQRLTFHQNELKIHRATVTKHDRKNDHEVIIDRINHHKTYNEVRLHSPHMIYAGTYTITLEFSGEITRPMNGIYPCFFEQDGVEKTLIATQFESHHAREAFPCIDEPEAKATFDLTLTTPASETVLANTPIKAQKQLSDDLVKTSFETTPKMSTYLLAFVFGDIDYKEAKTKEGVLVRTYATPDNVQFTDFALDVAVKCLEFYNDYFGIKYPLPKADLIALPDFASGAMENWGCITFREQCMLVDPANTSLPTKQYVAMVVAHELAHQWFGNLVTMRWWTDLWLNEGFASWIEYLAIDHLFPEWEMWTQFITDEQQTALRLDALDNTHPIEVPVHHPDEIRTIFDTISYNKGASVIHMLHEYLGPDAFRDGLRYYLERHSYSNTDTIDLWKALEAIAKKPVTSFMHTWTAQPGFPLIKASVDSDAITLSQSRFYTNPLEKKETSITWPIPLRAPLPLDNTLFDVPQNTWEGRTDVHHFKLNSGQSGFYRVVYNATHLRYLSEAIKQGKFSAVDRLGILSDVFEASKAAQADTAEALQLLKAYTNEDNAAVWDVIAAGISSIRGAMDDNELRELMKPFVRTLTAKQLKRLGWSPKPKETHFDSLLRPTILGMASLADESSVVTRCQELFDEMKTPDDIAPDLRSVVYNTVARLGDEKTFDRLLELHNSITLSEERLTLASAITGFQQPKLIQRALDLIKTKDIRLQDASYWIAYSLMNRYAKQATWQWVRDNWDWLTENLGTDMSFSRFPIYVARSFSNEAFLKEYQAFFEPIITPAIERTYKQGIEMIQWQAAWKKRDLSEIKAFFKNQQLH